MVTFKMNRRTLKVEEGTRLPLELDSSLPFATFETGESFVEFVSDVYLYMSDKKFMVSPDGQRWAEMGDWKAIKRVFGFKQGHLAIGLGVIKDRGAFMSVVVKTEG